MNIGLKISSRLLSIGDEGPVWFGLVWPGMVGYMSWYCLGIISSASIYCIWNFLALIWVVGMGMGMGMEIEMEMETMPALLQLNSSLRSNVGPELLIWSQ